jgi:hypothetical protein
MVLFLDGPRADLARTRKAGAWQRATHDPVSKIDDHGRLESKWVPYSGRVPNENQIQRRLLYNRNTPADQRLARKPSSSPPSKISCPCGQYKTTYSQLIDEFHGG